MTFRTICNDDTPAYDATAVEVLVRLVRLTAECPDASPSLRVSADELRRVDLPPRTAGRVGYASNDVDQWLDDMVAELGE